MNDNNLSNMIVDNGDVSQPAVKPPKLSKSERKKVRVLKKLIAKEINGTQAAKMLKITPRQVRNLKRQFINDGEIGIVHKNKFHKPHNSFDEEIRKEIAHIYRVEYRGVCFTEFANIIQERGYNLSRSTVYNYLRSQRIRSPKRKKRRRKKVEVGTTNASKKTNESS